MEEPPSNSDGLQPQDLSSAHVLPNLFDLKASPLDGLRVVQTPGWFVGPGTSNGTILPENDSDPLPTDQIPPDEAFSNAAVVLSYLSRSHVFSEHSPVYGVPFLRAYDGSDGGNAALSADQPVSVPVGLTACEPFGFMTPAQVVENMAAFCYLQQPPDIENLALETLKSLQADPSECRFPISVDELQNGAASALWNAGPFEGGFPEDGGADAEGSCPNPELVFLISRSEEPIEPEAASFAMPLNQEFPSPEDHGSPSAEQIARVLDVPEAADAKQIASVLDVPEAADAKQEEDSDLNGVQTDTSDGLSTERKTRPLRARRATSLQATIRDVQPVRYKSCRVRLIRAQARTSPRSEEKTTPKEEIRRSTRRKTPQATSSPASQSSGRTPNRHSFPTSRPATKKSHSRKRKKQKTGRSSFFPPEEPEIKLKCLSCKEERKEARDEAFVPYVRLHLKDFPACTVVNYPESKRGNRPAIVASGVIPGSPALRYGRVHADGTRTDPLVCSLCGSSANAMDLGDLHGPYFPEGFKSASKVSSHPEDNSDSEPPFRAARGGRTNSSRSSSPTAKRPRPDGLTDWLGPPVVPLDADEHWLHEDCTVWSAGVFLVRGKLYGLEKAVRLAKVSVCSTCQKRGATLGCVFKGCPNKYHYMCAVQSGCVLNEDNFSMKCRKHKNKSIKGSSCGQINR